MLKQGIGKQSNSLISDVKDLWRKISKHRQLQLVALVTLMFFTSLSEAFSIGAVFPFLAALSAPDKLMNQEQLTSIWRWLDITNSHQLLLVLTIIFCVLTVLCGLLRLILLGYQARFSHAIGADMSEEIYRRTLYQPYLVHIDRNSSEVIAGIFNKTNTVTYNIIIPTLTIISSSFFTIAILALIFWTRPMIAVVAFSTMSILYLGVIYFTKQQLQKDGNLSNINQALILKSLQEGLGGIRDILINGAQEMYIKIYRSVDRPMRRAQANLQIMGASPRYILEAVGAVLIAIMAYFMASEDGGVYEAIPVLGMFALAAQRLLPMLQQSYQAWSSMKGAHAALRDVIILLDQPIFDSLEISPLSKISFVDSIAFNSVSFRYQDHLDWALKDISFSIKKGDYLGLMGKTGSGKSTLADMLMGLLHPAGGGMLVDGLKITPENCRSWQKHVAHVPQFIYLADASIAENIAFGVSRDQINFQKVKLAAQNAQLSEVINSWPDSYNTIVGERGVRLSGGQRQRIGIARALYKEANVIILDEATSALDAHTEKLVMDSIKKISVKITLIIIAHRLSTLEGCDRIIELRNSAIIRSGSYREMVLQNPFRS